MSVKDLPLSMELTPGDPEPIHDLNFPCAICGAGAGQPCTKSCDDSLIPDEEVERVSCECGAAKLGHANYSPAHSSWCPVAE